MLQVFVVCLCACIAAAYVEWDLTSASVSYSLTNSDNKHSLSGSVPGLVHTDLIAAGIIDSDPYFGFRELSMSWVAREPFWKYSASIPSSLLRGIDTSVPAYLQFDGIDAVSEIRVNGVLLGETRSAFTSYTYTLHDLSSLLSGSFTLDITLFSAMQYVANASSAYPYSVPETENYNVWAEPSHRNFLRKAGNDWGWDWGPAYIPSGITGKARIFQSSIGRVEGVTVQQSLLSDHSAVTVSPNLRITGVASSSTAHVTVSLDDEIVSQQAISVPPTDVSYAVLPLNSFTIANPRLWWPRGMGEPHLYHLTIRYCDSSSNCVSHNKKIGIRSVELVQRPARTYTDGLKEEPYMLYSVSPATFFLRVNNIPVFARGANFIPIDAFQSRVAVSDREYILATAAASNMNMVRVWGGGIYQPDDFYEKADAMGLMVWQEFMFACALYPR